MARPTLDSLVLRKCQEAEGIGFENRAEPPAATRSRSRRFTSRLHWSSKESSIGQSRQPDPTTQSRSRSDADRQGHMNRTGQGEPINAERAEDDMTEQVVINSELPRPRASANKAP